MVAHQGVTIGKKNSHSIIAFRSLKSSETVSEDFDDRNAMMTHLHSMIGRNDGAMKPLYTVIYAMMTHHFFNDSVSQGSTLLISIHDHL